MGRRSETEGQASCARGSRLAALVGAALAFRAGRRWGRRCSRHGTAASRTRQAPKPPQRTRLGALLHKLRTPVRLEDRAKWRLKENPPPPEPSPDPCGKDGRGLCCVTGRCGEAAAKPENGEEKAKAKDEAGLTGIVVKVLGAIAAGIGVTGAVVVVGAVTLWARFDAIGVPPVQAVTAMPRTELLVQGGQEMVIFVLIALAATLLIALADPRGVITYGTVGVLGVLVIGAVIHAVSTELGWAVVLILVGLASLFALASVGIGFATDQRLLPLLVSVFTLTFLFAASCAVLIVDNQKFAQAIAIRFGPNAEGDDKGLTAIYVTVTEKTIFFARPDLDGATNTGLYEVPRAETTTYAIGPLESIEKDGARPVAERGRAMLEQLKEDAISFRPLEAKTGAGGKEDGAAAGE